LSISCFLNLSSTPETFQNITESGIFAPQENISVLRILWKIGIFAPQETVTVLSLKYQSFENIMGNLTNIPFPKIFQKYIRFYSHWVEPFHFKLK